MTPPIRLQPLVRARIARLGRRGEQWTRELPDTLRELAELWSLELGRSLPGGSSSYVVGARTADGRDAVLKIALPDPARPTSALEDQADVLRRAGGRGYVNLFAFDPGRDAVLLERLGPSLERSGRSITDQLVVIADTLAIAWRPAAESAAAPIDKASQLSDYVADAWERLERPCSAAVLRQALTYAERRAYEVGEPVVVHGDPHPGNLLAVPRPRTGADTQFCFVDPDGFVADRAYDLGVVLRDWSSAILTSTDPMVTARDLCRTLAQRSGVDEVRIWEWGFLERVSTGLYVLDAVGSPAVARPFLASAEFLAE